MYYTKRTVRTAIVLIAAIVAAAVFFHYPITVTDALSLEPDPEFGIHVPAWRIVFEPFLGLLLFFNQAFYAIREFMLMVLWVLALFLLYSMVRSFMLPDKTDRKRFVARQLVNLPIVAGIGFSLFVVMIFIALPGNTIVKKNPGFVLVNTHSHAEQSHDGLITREGLWKWHKRYGFDAFFLTEHNNHSKTLDFVQSQRNGEFPGEPLVMAGEEFSGSNHLSLLGLRKEFRTRGFADSMAVQAVRADSGAVLVNHWFDGERKSLEYYRDLGVDGFEIENTATDKRYDRNLYLKIKDFCRQNGLIMVGGLDFHGYGSACTLWNAFEIKGWSNMDVASKEASILNILKTRDQSRLKVLLYNDRPYYDRKISLFRPILNIVQYFRTLNFLQVLSWIAWILLLGVVCSRIAVDPSLKERLSVHRILPVAGFAGGMFLLVLGLVYLGRESHVADYTEMYLEYSSLLVKAGAALLVFSGLVVWFRIFRVKKA